MYLNDFIDSLYRGDNADVLVRHMCTKCLFVRKLSMKNVMRCVDFSIRDFYTRLRDYFSSGFYTASTFLRVYMPCTSGTPQTIKRSTTCKTNPPPRRKEAGRRRWFEFGEQQDFISLARSRTKCCLARHRILNITEGSFYDPLNISY